MIPAKWLEKFISEATSYESVLVVQPFKFYLFFDSQC